MNNTSSAAVAVVLLTVAIRHKDGRIVGVFSAEKKAAEKSLQRFYREFGGNVYAEVL